MRIASKLLPLAGALLLCLPLAIPPPQAADLGPAPSEGTAPSTLTLREALSRYLSLEMIRATFDIVAPGDIEAALEEQALRWGNKAPPPEALAELDQQLLAEASYYLVSLSYLTQVGGAAFPSDKAEMVYANDTIAKLDDLRRELFDAIGNGDDILPVLTELERIRALTEGHATQPADFGIFAVHDALLDGVLDKLERGTPT